MSDRIEVFKQMIEADPENTMVLFGLANEYLKIEEYADAIRILQKYLETADDEGAAYGMLAKAFEKINDRENARTSYQKGIEVSLAHGHPSMAEEYRETLESDFGD